MPDARLPARAPQATEARKTGRPALSLLSTPTDANTALLELQRMVGNQALLRMFADGEDGLGRGGRRGMSPLARMASQAHARGGPAGRHTRPGIPIQRHATGEPHDHSKEIAEAERLVSAAPEVP